MIHAHDTTPPANPASAPTFPYPIPVYRFRAFRSHGAVAHTEVRRDGDYIVSRCNRSFLMWGVIAANRSMPDCSQCERAGAERYQ